MSSDKSRGTDDGGGGMSVENCSVISVLSRRAGIVNVFLCAGYNIIKTIKSYIATAYGDEVTLRGDSLWQIKRGGAPPALRPMKIIFQKKIKN